MNRFFWIASLVILFGWVGSQSSQANGVCGGDGQDPCSITSWADLDNVRNGLDKSYILMNDLSSESVGYSTYAGPTANEGAGWMPIGVWEAEFIGSFDGNGYVVKDLTINQLLEGDEDPLKTVGLFGFVGEPGILGQGLIQDLTILNIQYQLTCPSEPLGRFPSSISIGGLMGFKQQSIEAVDIETSGTITVDFEECGDFGFISAEIGGVVGFNRGNVQEAYSSVDVSIQNPPTENFDSILAGGIAGFNQGTLSEVAFDGEVTGPVAGGISGFNDSSIVDAYSLGAVTSNAIAGGITGKNQGTFSRVYAAGMVTLTGEGDVAALVADTTRSDIGGASYWDESVLGEISDVHGEALDANAMRTQSSFEGWDFSDTGPWTIQSSGFRSYPYLRAFTYDAPEIEPPVRSIPGLQAICGLGFFSETGYAPCTPCTVGQNTTREGSVACRVETVPSLSQGMQWALMLILMLAGWLAMARLKG